jgi:hypothetical protein
MAREPANWRSGRLFAPARRSEIAELHVIAADLRRQRRDLDELLENTSKRSGQTAELIAKIEKLRRRAEETRRKFVEPHEGGEAENDSLSRAPRR